MERRWKLRKVIRIKIDLVLAAASVKVFLSFFAQSEKFFWQKSFFIFPGGFFSLASCRNLLKDLKKRWKWDWQRRSGSLICHQWKAKLHLDQCKLAGYDRCSTWSSLEVSHLSTFWKWRKSGWSESIALFHHSKVATKCDTTSIRQKSFGKPSIRQPSVGQVYNKGVDWSSNKYKPSIRQVI